jgi:hypothetical protein
MIGTKIWPGYKYIALVLLCLVFVRPVSADVQPVPTTIQTNIYVDGVVDGALVHPYMTTKSYTLYLPMDYPTQIIGTVSMLFKVFDGTGWYNSTDDVIQPLVSEINNNYIYSISVPVSITASGVEKIHELTLCYELLYSQPAQLVCNAVRWYVDDGSLGYYGYGVDYWQSIEVTPFTTLYYFDEYFISENRSFYCTLYTISEELCDALVPVPGLGWFDPNISIPNPPMSDPDNPEASYNSISSFGSSVYAVVIPSDWWNQVQQSVDSTMDENVYRGFVYTFEEVLPNLDIDVTPLQILSDYLYFFGMYLSTVRAIIPLDLLLIMVNLGLWGAAFLWLMYIYRFIRTLAL